MKRGELRQQVFGGCFGAFLGITLLKFGNPPIMEKYVETPGNIYELILGYPWPIGWAYLALFLIGIGGVAVARWRCGVPRWVVVLPAAWLIWQYLAASRSLSADLSGPTCAHFTAAAACFYLGFFALAPIRGLNAFWIALCTGFALVLVGGWEQHFGGLAETRRYFFLYIYPRLAEVPPEYLKKISSERIFSTLFYPNALAGALLLFLPATLAVIWRMTGGERFTPAARWFLVCLPAAAAGGCLVWSGSKGGALLMLMLGVVTLLSFPLRLSLKLAVIGVLLVAGLSGFFWKYSAFFNKGATSVSARFDYWQAAARTALDKPVTGTGPGTFGIPYAALKRPDSEMSRLVHNDYLEQATDSGLPGAIAYAAFVLFALIYGRPRSWALGSNPAESSQARVSRLGERRSMGETESIGLQEFAVWLGALGWAVQGGFEFGLYIPALSWSAFAFLGWLLGRAGEQGNVTVVNR